MEKNQTLNAANAHADGAVLLEMGTWLGHQQCSAARGWRADMPVWCILASGKVSKNRTPEDKENTHEISDRTSTIDGGPFIARGKRYLRESRQGRGCAQQRRSSGLGAGSYGLGQPSRQGGSRRTARKRDGCDARDRWRSDVRDGRNDGR